MREGEIVQLGDPLSIYNAPSSRFVAEFMGQVNLLAVAANNGSGAMLKELGIPVDQGFRDASERLDHAAAGTLAGPSRARQGGCRVRGRVLQQLSSRLAHACPCRRADRTYISELGADMSAPAARFHHPARTSTGPMPLPSMSETRA